MFERIAPAQHDTLDGIPEPAENQALFGHREATASLAAAYRSGKLPHALLFSGPRGIGKATLAFRLARHLLAHPDPSAAPDELAEISADTGLFRQVAMGAHPSVLHLTRPENDRKGFKTVVTVEEIRRVGRFLSMTAHDGGYRVVIVDPADDMNASAANALLKNLEEPPSKVVFVLIAHAPGGLLPTIRSRCRVVRLAPLDTNDLTSALGAVGSLPGDKAAREALIDRSAGSVRTAIEFAQYGGVDIAEVIDRLATAKAFDVATAHKLADAVAGRDAAVAFTIFGDRLQELLSQAAGQAAAAGDIRRAGQLAQAWQEAGVAADETLTYNLDRKQHTLNMIARLHDLLRM